MKKIYGVTQFAVCLRHLALTKAPIEDENSRIYQYIHQHRLFCLLLIFCFIFPNSYRLLNIVFQIIKIC